MENAKAYDLKMSQFLCELIKIQLNFQQDSTSADATQKLRSILQTATSLVKEVNELEDQEEERMCQEVLETVVSVVEENTGLDICKEFYNFYQEITKKDKNQGDNASQQKVAQENNQNSLKMSILRDVMEKKGIA